MRKKEMIKVIGQQRKTIEDLMDIFKILVEGGKIGVHIYKNQEPGYFVYPKKGKSDVKASKRIYEGLYSRGLLTLDSETVHEDDIFVVQRFALRVPKETKNKE